MFFHVANYKWWWFSTGGAPPKSPKHSGLGIIRSFAQNVLDLAAMCMKPP